MVDSRVWDADKNRYESTQIGHGMTAYTLKKGMENGEPLPLRDNDRNQVEGRAGSRESGMPHSLRRAP
jgi:hypothetical protein